MVSSAAVPLRPEVVERELSALSDDDVEHLAALMARRWRASNRVGAVCCWTPIGACTAVAAAVPPASSGIAFGFGVTGLFLGSIVSVIVSSIFGRSLALEVETLGYDRSTARAVERAYQRSIRKFLPRFTLRSKTKTCVKELLRLRARGG